MRVAARQLMDLAGSRLLLSELGRHRGPLAQLAGWTLIEAIPPLLSGQMIARAIDRGFVLGRPATGLAYLLVLFGLYALGMLVIRQCYPPVAIIVESLRDVLLRRVVRATLEQAVADGQPDLAAVARITQQVETVRDVTAGLLLVLRRVAVRLCAAVVGLFLLDHTIALLALPPLALAVAAFAVLTIVLARQRRAVFLADEQVATSASLMVDNVRDVAACGAEQHARQIIGIDIDRQIHATSVHSRTAVFRTPIVAVGAYAPAILLLVAAPSLRAGGMTIGVIIGGIVYITTTLEPALRSLTYTVSNAWIRLAVALGRLAETSAIPLPEPRKPAGERRGHRIEATGVTFAYSAHAEPIIRNLDLSVPAGAHLAVVGPSGIGKSTLANLIAGVEHPQSGTITIGGVPAGELDCDDPHRTITLIPQEAYVFAGTMWENLTYLRQDAPAHEVQAVSELFGLGPLIARLGDLHEQLSSATLSAGERQLIALARAYLSTSPIIVLDEATCHLDPTAEAGAEEAFAQRAETTLIVIAHRITSAHRAQYILLIGDTETRFGTHESLLEGSGLYRDLAGLWNISATPHHIHR